MNLDLCKCEHTRWRHGADGCTGRAADDWPCRCRAFRLESLRTHKPVDYIALAHRIMKDDHKALDLLEAYDRGEAEIVDGKLKRVKKRSGVVSRFFRWLFGSEDDLCQCGHGRWRHSGADNRAYTCWAHCGCHNFRRQKAA